MASMKATEPVERSGREVPIWPALLAAVVLLWLSWIYGNQYDAWAWWRGSALAGVGLCLVVAVFGPGIAAVLNGKLPRAALAAGGIVGLLLLGGGLALMVTRYSEAYYVGSLSWPHVLALLGLLGFALIVVSAAAFSGRPSAPLVEPLDGQSPLSSIRWRFGVVGLGVVGGVFGLFLGVLIGIPLGRWLDPPDPNAFLDFSGLEYVLLGAFIGSVVGAVWPPLAASRRLRRHPHEGTRPGRQHARPAGHHL